MNPIFSAEDNLVTQITVGKPLGTSDHDMVRCFIQLPVNRAIPNAIRCLNFRLANFGRFKRDLNNLQPNKLETVQALCKNFKSRFLEVQGTASQLRVYEQLRDQNRSGLTEESKRPWLQRIIKHSGISKTTHYKPLGRSQEISQGLTNAVQLRQVHSHAGQLCEQTCKLLLIGQPEPDHNPRKRPWSLHQHGPQILEAMHRSREERQRKYSLTL